MTKYNNSTSHRGHNARTPGAAGNGLREHEVAQKIHEKFITETKAVDCTDDAGTTANANLVNIVAKMNRVGISFHVSHHLNAFNGQANGFEVWYFAGNETARKLAQAICDEVCKATGWVNRGAKATTSLYVIRASVGTAVLIEWGFIDSKRDMDILSEKMDDAVNAALKAMGYSTSSGGSSNGGGSSVATPTPQPTPSPIPTPTQPTQLTVDGSLGPLTARRWQEVTKMQIQDGRISHQWRQAQNQNIHAAIFDTTLKGSNLIRDTQRRLGITQDGLCGTQTITAMQCAKGTTADGFISTPQSQLVMAIQRDLNSGRSPF
ncbi:N-acetylmuramoyl-L-alanine amidase [Enterococcus casseliflavus 14-MB-W-14]|uniref:N-acetylmuramoyl-L-alanine amidase n=1 Tax=Enterococcus casseliflavus TaxID=37734 RepID=UPI00035406DE|nr:N-acetylmuramoyl-L-alanine amidase [Enterococcus casseliflavus]EPH64125.1 N-acetylmuramoyl-L-alanine amidase [Enterococcus casseliflavus 14-MB-W-14]